MHLSCYFQLFVFAVSQNVDAECEYREHYSRMSLVIIDTFPNILRDVIRSSISAHRLYQLCIPHLSSFTPDQQKNLQDLNLMNSYASLDISIIYRLLRQFQLIPPPTLGWGNFPNKDDNTLGDDVERIRYYRNQVAHRNNTNIEKNEFEDYFNHFLSIGHRMDLNLSQGTNYEKKIDLHKTCRIDIQMQIKYENALKELENIKMRYERTQIKFYWGESFERSLVQLRSIIQDEKLKGRQKVRVQIIFQCESDVEKTIDILNSLRDEINAGLSGIEFIVANKGSIILNVDLALDSLETDERLLSTIALFLGKIIEPITTCPTERIDMVLVPIEEFTTWNKPKASTEPVYLHFDFEADVFETDDKIEEQLRQICDAISKHSNGSATKSNITATLLPIKNISTTEEAFVQAQSPVIHNLPSSVTLRQHLNIELSENEYWIMCDCIKIGNMLAFIDESFRKRMIVCNVDGTDVRCIPLSYKPWYITEVNSNTIAVSCTHDKIILIVNVSSGSVTGKIVNSDCCFGISHDDDKLFVVIKGTLHVMDLTGYIIRIIPLPSYTTMDITVQRKRLVCIDETSVYCCWLDGTLMWKFDDKKFKHLSHLATDNMGNVYVTDSGNNSLIVISDDGRHYREILKKSDGLCRPYGVHFDMKENILMVCNESNRTALLYDVKEKHNIN
ncbi:unnamed protein product [Mytilus coruscus]|uniref:DZIP3-like HEPN domain-containing protein n=1 Tax=Mytilus coruscus TaxID=42192 RepID=A0A6J8BIL8_MYTCO|nr:unnamed protein product [Mytilus coruscus]